MAEKDRKRLGELRAKEKEGILTYLERIELELLNVEDMKATGPEVEAGAWEDIGEEEEKVVAKVIGGPRPAVPPAGERMDEFEVVPIEENEEEEDESPPPKRPAVAGQVGAEQKKMAAAFGAGAIVGYFLRELLEDEKDDEEPGPEEGADD